MGRPRHKRKRPSGNIAAAEGSHPLADPARPIPNLACADRFEAYYRVQLRRLGVEGAEWARFIRTLHAPLPVTFRVQPSGPLGDECRRSFDALIASTPSLPTATALPWCSSYSVDISKEALKASHDPALAGLQTWLSKWGALGACTRQAIESMVPVALLEIQPHHVCLDLCASPGSKTTQAIEALYAGGGGGGGGGGGSGGFMVANDVSPARCQMLLRRCAALGEMSERLLVTCHPAQRLPWLPAAAAVGGAGEAAVGAPSDAADACRYPEGCYDRIICDVPCSGDGTTRKNPSIWHRWSQEYALEMHPLQTQIAMRGLALLKVGGLLCYSTCSLNPLENEAVSAP